ncbi:MAG: 16S rRNA (guanine(966)-N(2))-methyltransferase RsmD [Ignavibacteriales bacterium]|nr:16S rRNA (guanine(966)-N(2))-methyltransferase RsmD [Ignavibacteriales bacterium]
MRIISGKYGGRILKVPSTKFTRPTTDRVRETLFNLLNNKIDFNGIEVLDIYAGSGSLGLESLSRGASHVDFIEKNFPVYKVLKQNITSIFVDEFCKIFKMNALDFSKATNHKKYNLIFADPPFFKNDIHEVMKNLLTKDFLLDDGLIVVERSIQTKEKDVENFGIEPFKKIGDTLLYQFEKT